MVGGVGVVAVCAGVAGLFAVDVGLVVVDLFVVVVGLEVVDSFVVVVIVVVVGGVCNLTTMSPRQHSLKNHNLRIYLFSLVHIYLP